MDSPRNVVEAIMRGGSPERVALMDRPWSDTLRKWIGQGYPVDEKGAPVDPTIHFGFDTAGCGGWFEWQARMGVREVVEESDEWEVVRNGNGASHKWWKHKSGTPEHVAFEMSSREIWERDFRPHLPGTAGQRVTRERVEETALSLARHRDSQRWIHYGHQFIWENLRNSLGDLSLFIHLLTDPGWIRDYCRVYTDLYKECFAILLEQAGKPDGMWIYEDLGYRDALFCSPQVYRDLIFPFYAEIVSFFRGYDLPVVLHTCGFEEPALDMIVEAGFCAVDPMEVKAGNDPLRIAARYGDRLALIGGLDVRILESGDRDHIRRQVTRLIEGMKAAGARYIYMSDHSISTNVDYDDFRYSLDVYRDHMCY
ncbi:MAG: uroporphyrinogen decarboxylase family protein [Gemmatimonadota bacterium]